MVVLLEFFLKESAGCGITDRRGKDSFHDSVF